MSEFLAEHIERSLRVYPEVAGATVTVSDRPDEWELAIDITVGSAAVIERVIQSVTHELLPTVEQLAGRAATSRRVDFHLPSGETVHSELLSRRGLETGNIVLPLHPDIDHHEPTAA